MSQSGLASFSNIIRFISFYPVKFGWEVVEIMAIKIYSPIQRWRKGVVWIGPSAPETRGGSSSGRGGVVGSAG